MKLIILIAIGMLLTCYGLSQSLITDSPSAISNEMVKNIAVQQEKFVEQLQRRQKKLLIRLQKQEEKIVSKLRKTDSLKAALLHTDIESKYSLLQQKLEPSVSRFSSPYISRIDSLETMLKWLDPLSNKKQELDKALSAVNGLKVQLSQAQDLQSFITERQQVFKSLLSVDGLMNKLPIKGLSKFVRRYNKEVYYYKERVNSLRETLNTPDKLEKEALSIVRKLPAFQKFMQQNSQLAQLFGAGMPDGSTAATNALTGLQTRASVMILLEQQFGGAVSPLSGGYR